MLVNMNTSKAKYGEIHSGGGVGSHYGLLPIGFSVEKATKTTCGAPHYSYFCYMLDTRRPCSFSFLLLDIPLYDHVLVSERAETKAGPLFHIPKYWESWSLTFLFFPGQRNSFWIGVSLAQNRAVLRNEMGQTKKLFFFHFLLDYSQSFFFFFLLCNNLRYAESICRYAF